MTFSSARGIASARLNESLVYLNYISSIEPSAGVPVAVDYKVMKGLFFVLLYGALEKSATESIQLLLVQIKSLEPKNEHVTTPFNVVSMARKWKSIKDKGYKGAFSQMTDFFSALESNDYLGIDETLFSDLMQNVWANTIDEVVGAFGMSGFTLTIAERVLVDELVNNRNAIAHGRESAASVGERYRCDELRRRHGDIQALINNFIDRLETYFNTREFVRPMAQAHYPV
jgi:hypothetical protein